MMVEEKSYWLCQMGEEHRIPCLEDSSYGVPEAHPAYGLNQISLVREGDILFFYILGKGLVGYSEAVSRMYENWERIWTDGKKYPFRVRFGSIQKFSSSVPFGSIKGRVSNMQIGSLISDSQSLRGKSMIPISFSDARYILDKPTFIRR